MKVRIKEKNFSILPIYLVTSLLVLSSLTAYSIYSDITLKSKICQQVAIDLRNSILSGGSVENYSKLNYVYENYGISTSIYTDNDQILLNFPNNKSKLSIFAYKKQQKYFYDQNEKEIAGYFVFEFDLIDNWQKILFLWIFATILSTPLFIKISNLIQQWHQKNSEIEKSNAIARTTQMLAHDVRKPFSMLHGVIDLALNSDDPSSAKRILEESFPHISVAISSVNGMIQDVMEIGSDAEPNLDSVRPESLIESCLANTFRFNHGSEIELTYSFNHFHMAKVDTIKTARVFSNIIDNAIELMRGRGQIWFRTNEVQGDFIEFCIGNSNTYICAKDRSKIFDSFYTKGKKGGTGLGLAIAKKIVESHSGKIWCESYEKKGTEFYFTLPIDTKKPITPEYSLHHNSKKFMFSLKNSALTNENDDKFEQNVLENSLITKFRESGIEKLRVLVCDDEAIYRNLINEFIARSDKILNYIDLTLVDSAEKATKLVRNGILYDVIIMDLEFGHNNMGGFEASQIIRSLESQSLLCVHSNQDLRNYNDIKDCIGNSLILPKPMTRRQFLELLTSRLDTLLKVNSSCSVNLLIFDDEPIFINGWKRIWNKGEVISYLSFESFLKEKIPDEFWKKIDYIITDYYMTDSNNGTDIARRLHNLGIKIPIFLSSNILDLPQEERELFAAILPKHPVQAIDKIAEWEKANPRRVSKPTDQSR